jgi:hypothetical protein
MVVLLDYSSIGTIFQILLRQVDFGVFLMVAARMIILAIFVPAATSSTMVIRILGSLATSTWLFGLFPGILVLILSPILVDYFNGYVRARSLGIAAQIKNMGAPLLVFLGIWYDICAIIFWLPSEKYKIMS